MGCATGCRKVVSAFPRATMVAGLPGGERGKGILLWLYRWKYKFAKDYPSFSAMKNKIANGVEGSLSSRTTIRDNEWNNETSSLHFRKTTCLWIFLIIEKFFTSFFVTLGKQTKKKKKKERWFKKQISFVEVARCYILRNNSGGRAWLENRAFSATLIHTS